MKIIRNDPNNKKISNIGRLELIKNNIFNCENKIKIYKANTFNSIIYEFHNDDFIIHMMDMDEQNRINIANQKLISISI